MRCLPAGFMMEVKRVVCTRSFLVGLLVAYATIGLLAFALQDYVTPTLNMKASLFDPKSSTKINPKSEQRIDLRDLEVDQERTSPGKTANFKEQKEYLEENKFKTLKISPSFSAFNESIQAKGTDEFGLGGFLKSKNKPLSEEMGLLNIQKDKILTPANIKCKDNLAKHSNLRNKLDCRKRLPQAIGIGVIKCGTGAMHQFLTMHPHVAFSEKKELYYWTTHKDMSLDWYRNLMPTSSKYQITMEFTPLYIFGLETPHLIKRSMPNTKFIVMLRDPVVRVVSEYVHQLTCIKNTGRNLTKYNRYIRRKPGEHARLFLNGSFDKSVIGFDGEVLKDNTLIDHGCYAFYLQRWLEVFPREQFLIIDEGLFRKDTIHWLQVVERFLGLPPYFNKDKLFFNKERNMFCKAEPVRKCPSPKVKGRPHPEVSEAVLTKLANFYRPHNERLTKLLDRNFSWAL